MMVPRSFKYASSPPNDLLEDKVGRKQVKNKALNKTAKPKAVLRPASPVHASTQPVEIVSQPVAVPKPERSHSAGPQTMPTRTRKAHNEPRGAGTRAHDPDALPPAVAALLAVTAIPPRRSGRMRRKTSDNRRMSIDELVSEWKSEESIKSSYGSSLALSVLLEDSDDAESQGVTPAGSRVEERTLHGRSESAESIPSLDSDERSLWSFGSPSTPESVRSNRSSSYLKRDRTRLQVTAEDSSFDHPLVPPPLNDEDNFIFSATSKQSSAPRSKSSFTSNLTTSLKALRSAAITSISSFGLGNPQSQGAKSALQPFSDEMLWSHPFLFPQFSSEIRPDIQGTPTLAQRRYMNPAPLTFEEQEAPFQQALHAPYLAQHEHQTASTAHEMQSYGRGKRKSSQQKRPAPDPQSEAGRSVLAAAGVRQREPRENSDFLRVVVLEMNMRREGKLETGRARIWLPPRQVTAPCEETNGIPDRWRGQTAY